MYRKPFQNHFYGDDPRWFVGVVETPSIADKLGRVRVRVYGLHSNNAIGDIDTDDLPLAQVMIPGTEEGTKGLGMNAQLEVGAMVFGFFLDGKASQLPFVLGSFPRIEISDPAVVGAPGEAARVLGASGSSGESGSSGTASPLGPASNVAAPGYPPEMTQARIEEIIREEAILRNIDPDTAIKIYREEGRISYQSGIDRTGSGSYNGKEASFGPYQLFIGGGLGNDYERLTGRSLITDNTVNGITNQIRFALDAAASQSWAPWYGRGPAGVGVNEGLENASPIGNWD